MIKFAQTGATWYTSGLSLNLKC